MMSVRANTTGATPNRAARFVMVSFNMRAQISTSCGWIALSVSLTFLSFGITRTVLAIPTHVREAPHARHWDKYLGACVSNARLLRPPQLGIFLRSFPLHMRRLCAENDRRKLLELGRPRYGDHYSHRLLVLQVDGIADQGQVRLAVPHIDSQPVPPATGLPEKSERRGIAAQAPILQQGYLPAVKNDFDRTP
jgi:hypothetical protein